MSEIARVDVQGSKNEFCSVFRVEVWTSENTYFFSFDESFYSCYKAGLKARNGKPDDFEVVDSGSESGLDSLEMMNVAEFCKVQVEKLESAEA
jgi:hypothetical protein